MHAAHFDTQRFVARLKAAGIAEDVAIAQSDALVEAFEQSVGTSLATKLDIVELRGEISALREEMRGASNLSRWMGGANFVLLAAVLVRTFFQ